MTIQPPIHNARRRRPRAALLAAVATAALGLASIPALASAASATTPTITSVTFSTGTALKSPTPLVIIRGSGFGSLPRLSPGGDPQINFSDCGRPSGYDGLDFGSSLYFNLLSGSSPFEAGNGASGNCIGLVIWSHTSTQIKFGFGSVYAGFARGLQAGDSYSLHVDGVSASGTISF